MWHHLAQAVNGQRTLVARASSTKVTGQTVQILLTEHLVRAILYFVFQHSLDLVAHGFLAGGAEVNRYFIDCLSNSILKHGGG